MKKNAVYYSGHQGFHRGLALSKNPFASGTDNNVQWAHGWEDAYAEDTRRLLGAVPPSAWVVWGLLALIIVVLSLVGAHLLA